MHGMLAVAAACLRIVERVREQSAAGLRSQVYVPPRASPIFPCTPPA